MADDETRPSKASKFLKKSKWGKVLKQDDSDIHSSEGAFKLNEDVVDFLKPSTEKGKPKLDIAIAKRWPEAHQVRQAGQSSPSSEAAPRYTKSRRRKGLSVSFVRTVPEIIGEGGDEAPDPPSEISRRKAAVTRSVSDSRPSAHDEWLRSTPLPQLQQQSTPPRPPDNPDNFAAPPMHRANTSYNELSPPIQRRHASPPKPDVEPYRPSIGRTPTGFDLDDSELRTPPDQSVEDRPSSRQRLSLLDTRFDSEQTREASASQSPTPGSRLGHDSGLFSPSHWTEQASPTVQKRREMTRNEGMAFRRASSMIHKDDEGSEYSRPGSGYQSQGFAAQYPNECPAATGAPRVILPPEAGPSPETAMTPDAPNPIHDPKYSKRHSRESSPAVSQHAHSTSQSLRQPRPTQSCYERGTPVVPPPRSPLSGKPPVEHPEVQPRKEAFASDNESALTNHLTTRSAAQIEAQRMGVPSNRYREHSKSPGLREHLYKRPSSPEKPAVFMRPNGSSSSLNHHAHPASHSRSRSQDENQNDLQSTLSGSQHSASPSFQNALQNGGSPRSSHGPTPRPRSGYGDLPEECSSHIQSKSSATATPRQGATSRPGSSGSYYSYRPSASPQPHMEGNPAADAAFADFAARVTHVKSVFRLTAEKQIPGDHCTPLMWLRCALWWYSIGKSGLEALLQRRDPRDTRELLTQAHVDLAKAWWILTDLLDDHGMQENAGDPEGGLLKQGLTAIKTSIKMLSLSISKNNLLPPVQSLIQGQNTTVWLDYPRFTSEAAAVLGGSVSNSVLVKERKQMFDPYELLPLNDTREHFCYGRFQVAAYLNTEDAETDRVALPCMLTVLRSKREFQTTIIIASQSELVNIRVQPRQSEQRCLTWQDVSWKASSSSMSIRLPRNFDLSIRMDERDFRAVWSLCDYARKVEKCLREEEYEKLVHQTKLAELQYADSSNPNAFPPEKVRGCSALVFERFGKHVDGSGTRRVHRGFRLLLMTDASHKTLSAVNHDIGRRSPFYFEYLTDSTANGTTAMVIRTREERRQCRMLLVFPDAYSRQELYNVLNGLDVKENEEIMGRMILTSLNIEPASQSLGFSQSAHPALSGMQWQKLGVTNALSDDSNAKPARTVESEHLRILARHSTGCITDRLNLGKGELLLRFPPIDTPCVQILRNPQEDITISIDTRHSTQQVSEGIGQVLQTVLEQPTIRTFTFATPSDLHAFETAITGFVVRFDGIASAFGISRRRMVVPIYKKYEASHVRIQVVSQGAVVQIVAFMEEFSHADAMVFQVKSTDTFETGKGDNKNKKWTVKLVDAKFTLLSREKGRGESEEERLKGRFVNLEGLDYAEEHDDITVGFDTEHDRDRFAQTLPAATTAHRGITLKRRT